MFPAFAVTKSYFVYFSESNWTHRNIVITAGWYLRVDFWLAGSFIFAGAFLLTAIQLAIIADTYWSLLHEYKRNA